MKKVKISPNINIQTAAKIKQFAAEHKKPVAEVLREIIDLGVGQYDKNHNYPNYQPYGKNNLMRAERAAIYASVINNFLLRTRISQQEYEECEERAKEILGKLWDYE